MSLGGNLLAVNLTLKKYIRSQVQNLMKYLEEIQADFDKIQTKLF